MYTTSDDQLPTSTTPPTSWLVGQSAKRAAADASEGNALATFNGLLCRNPADFASFGLNVAKDVAVVNQATGCQFQTGTPSSSAVSNAGDSVAASILSALGITPNPTSGPAQSGPGGIAPSSVYRSRIGGKRAAGQRCSNDVVSDAAGASNAAPLNSGGSLPAVSAAPATLSAPTPGLSRHLANFSSGMGRYTRRGMGDCCSGLPWGDAYPNGGPSASSASSFWSWVQSNPWLAAGGLAAGLWALSAAGKKSGGRRG